jgi:hypothetical protein
MRRRTPTSPSTWRIRDPTRRWTGANPNRGYGYTGEGLLLAMAMWRSHDTARGVFAMVNEICRGILRSPAEECLLCDDDHLPRSLWSPSSQPLWPEQPQMRVPTAAAMAVVLTVHTMMGLLRWSATRYGMIWARMGDGQGIAYVILRVRVMGRPPQCWSITGENAGSITSDEEGAPARWAPLDWDGGRTHHC